MATYQATNHLLNDGQSRIGFVLGKRNITTTGERLAGFMQAINEKNLSGRKTGLLG